MNMHGGGLSKQFLNFEWHNRGKLSSKDRRSQESGVEYATVSTIRRDDRKKVSSITAGA
jgi:hypothetical protein